MVLNLSPVPLYGFRRLVAGNYYGPGPHQPTTATSTQSLLQVIPFWLPHAATFDRISCEVTTTAGSSTVRLGIYNSTATDMPGTVLLDAGTVDSAGSTGVKEITISQAMSAGLYWLGAVAQGGAPGLRVIGNISQPPVAANSFVGGAATVGLNCYYMGSVTGALATWSGANTSAGGFKVMLRAA